jgi:hypothetical protein
MAGGSALSHLHRERIMSSSESRSGDAAWQHDLVSEARKTAQERQKGYRAQALALLPWVCARCAREFSGRKLRELTVHHKDHNHDNNPRDGSNWELLCLYCHDNEHSRKQVADAYVPGAPAADPPVGTYQPFAGLDALLKKQK